MDPYLEAHWGDVHTRLITYAADELQSALPDDLCASIEEQVFVSSSPESERPIVPDVRVFETEPVPGVPESSGTGLAVAEPLVIQVPEERGEPMTHRYLEIREVGSEQVITIIEFVSPSNKQSTDGRTLYRQKQWECRDAGVSLVEVDLTRRGPHVLAAPNDSIPASHRTPYRICVSRGWRNSEVEFYRVPLRERLPIIKIPLRETDDDAPLDLQCLLDRAYANGRYARIDYTVAPDPPLDPDDASWADALLREKGLRQ